MFIYLFSRSLSDAEVSSSISHFFSIFFQALKQAKIGSKMFASPEQFAPQRCISRQRSLCQLSGNPLHILLSPTRCIFRFIFLCFKGYEIITFISIHRLYFNLFSDDEILDIGYHMIYNNTVDSIQIFMTLSELWGFHDWLQINF